jgi:hypothetical protein
MIKFNLSNFTIDAAAPGEPARRTITGTALPYDTLLPSLTGQGFRLHLAAFPRQAKCRNCSCTTIQLSPSALSPNV